MEHQERLKAALADRYQIEREIGSGGMATVYLAEDLKHHRLVALKVLDPELGQAVGADRFLREIETAANLTHPHILPLFDSGEAEGFLFYVMPFVEGESLREKLTRETQLPVEEALKIGAEVADAVGYAHKRGIVHRDIKPENILLGEGHALVADFGIALAVGAVGSDRLTNTGLSVGTPAYMSPEQVAGEERVDGRSDLYSLACVLYEMLVGDPPFTGPTPRIVLARHLAAEVPSITGVRSAVPKPVAAAITKALGKAPADRFESARAFWEALSAESVETESQKKSVAVLAFTNMSSDPENEYLGDGIAEEVINALTKLPDLRVAARTSAFTFKGQAPDLKEVGAKLGVATVLEGSVRRSGNRLRITAQLIDVSDGFHLWSERYDREMDDVFSIQDEIASTVVEKLKVSLLGAPEGPTGRGHTEDLEAYELFLRGRYLANQRGAALQKGLECYKRAVQRDPGYALAHAGMADALGLIGFWNGTRRHDAFQEGKAAAHRALELDPMLAEAHASAGFVAIYYEWDWALAERQLLQALEINPQHVGTLLYYAQYLGWIKGDSDLAVQHLRRAHELDPLSVAVTAQLGGQLIAGGRVEEGLAELERTLEFAPNLVNAHWFRGMACRWLSRYEEGISGLERAVRATNRQPYLVGELALTNAAAGHHDVAQSLIDEEALVAHHPWYVGAVNAVMGRTDLAFEWLERAFEQRDPVLPGATQLPEMDPVRADPRYHDLVHRLALP